MNKLYQHLKTTPKITRILKNRNSHEKEKKILIYQNIFFNALLKRRSLQLF